MVPPPALSALSAVSMGSALPIHMGLILASDAMQTQRTGRDEGWEEGIVFNKKVLIE